MRYRIAPERVVTLPGLAAAEMSTATSEESGYLE
jgi:hypothetical protein